jgi:hypothetical protein
MSDASTAFRLNLEQQRKRAKELLKQLKNGDPAALARLNARSRKAGAQSLKLADAQHVIARELGFEAWSGLKAHIGALDQALAAIHQQPPPDAGLRTLHLRCGSDIQATLQAAGFGGDFLEISYPYCHGPVSAAANHLELEARFLAELTEPLFQISFEEALRHRQEAERALASSAAAFERIVLWMEHDCFDQMVLLRCLAHYASTQPPRVLELISIDRFPGTMRFIGLGQLPAEALRLLWRQRRPVDGAQLALAEQAFAALRSEDPRPLAALMRSGAAALPYLAASLHRLLQELPWVDDGLSLTERLSLQLLAQSQATFQRVFSALTYELDPLPFATDLRLMQTLIGLSQRSQPLLVIASEGPWHSRRLHITESGRAVLRGDCDAQSLQPRGRWVGGVHVSAAAAGWRWDEARRDAVWWPAARAG